MLTVREHCPWPCLAGPPLGPSVWWHLGVQVEMFPADSSGGRASPAVWLIVCVCHGACQQGWFVYSGQSKGLGIRTSEFILTMQCPWLCLSCPTTEARIKKNRFVQLALLICQLQLRMCLLVECDGEREESKMTPKLPV